MGRISATASSGLYRDPESRGGVEQLRDSNYPNRTMVDSDSCARPSKTMIALSQIQDGGCAFTEIPPMYDILIDIHLYYASDLYCSLDRKVLRGGVPPVDKNIRAGHE